MPPLASSSNNSSVQRLKARAGVLLVDNNQLLLMRQNDKPFWVFPGGTLEAHETLAECAVRELLEETGLAVTLHGLAAVTELLQPERQVIDTFFWAGLAVGSPEPPSEWEAAFPDGYPENINAIQWFSVEEALQLSILPKPVAKRLVKVWALGQHTTYPNWGYLPGEGLA
jgi:8-oxo-dGTP pyrophosphatase MutT (NUDIX family)